MDLDLDVQSLRYTGAISFIVQCDSRSTESDVARNSRVLLKGSVVALCTSNKPARLGTISIRSDGWFQSSGGPKIGVVFQP